MTTAEGPVLAEPAPDGPAVGPRTSLGVPAARQLATTTKSEPQMQAISSRWLIEMLPWIDLGGGSYRVNRRLQVRHGSGRVRFEQNGADDIRVLPQTLAELTALRGYRDTAALGEIAARFRVRELRPGEALCQAGQPITDTYLIAHGRIVRHTAGPNGEDATTGTLSDGAPLGDEALGRPGASWPTSARADTAVILLALPVREFTALAARTPSLAAHLAAHAARQQRPANRKGEADLPLRSGHAGETELPSGFADYELTPRTHELSLTQTVLRVHTRVADLYGDPMDQTAQQLRLTVEAVRERQEWELVNNRDFGLLHATDHGQRIDTRSGPPTPDDLDELLSMRRGTRLLLAHPKAIAAFFHQCTRRGLTPGSTEIDGHRALAWRGVPLLPCGKIPIDARHTTSILALRTGEDEHGVVGLHQTGIPEEHEPGLNVRFMGIDATAVTRYLVTAYYSLAILVPDAAGMLENVQIGRPAA